jgi:ribosomal protein S6--L-glutamate ligase
MEQIKKYILLNAGTKTRHAFLAGLDGLPCAWYRTRYMALHINRQGIPQFLYKNMPIDWSDAQVFTRLRATDQQFCGILYDFFAHHRIPASDPINHSYTNSAEKISQMLILALSGIRIPETIIFREESYRRNRAYIEEHLTFPCIYKTDGSKGKNVHYVENFEGLDVHLEKKKPAILGLAQPFIQNEFDTRTIVVYGKILGSIKRTRTQGYLNNIAHGATPSPYSLTPQEEATAITAASVCGIDIAGVDMIHTEHGPVVLEVNKSPQITGFESVHHVRVFEEVAKIMRLI